MVHPDINQSVVLHVTDNLNFGGSEKLMTDIAIGLNSLKYKSCVCSLVMGGVLQNHLEENKILTIIMNKKKGFDVSIIYRLYFLYKKMKPTIVHTYRPSANFWGRIPAIFARVPIIIATEHNYEKSNISIAAINYLLSLFTHKIIAVSQEIATQLIKVYHINENKVQIIDEGIDFTEYHPRPKNYEYRKLLSINNNAIIIGLAGRLMEQKGHKTFLHAFQKVLNEFPNVYAVIAGEGPLAGELQGLAEKLKINNNLSFVGFRKDLSEFLSQLDLFVMPSLWEGMPIALINAAACEIPIIATSVGGIPEFIKDNINGHLVTSGDPEALSQKIILALKQLNKAREMAKVARQDALNRYSIRRMIHNHEELYDYLINNRTTSW